jgi:methylmalonyl-CoA mutase C-terminal domain/subunit
MSFIANSGRWPMNETSKIRVLIAKVGLDGHDRGAKLLSMALYMGLRNSPEVIAQTVLQENVDVVGISSLAGSHLETARMVLGALKKNGMDEVLFLIGGIIPKKDFEPLKSTGVHGVFSVHSSFEEIIDFIKINVPLIRNVSA